MNEYMAHAAAPKLFSSAVWNAENTDAALNAYEQQDKKPAIDNVICHYLDGSTLKNALNFIDYVRASKMKIKWTAVNVWSVRYKNKRVLDIIVSADSWRVRLVFDHINADYVFTVREQENINNLIGAMKNLTPTCIEPSLALS